MVLKENQVLIDQLEAQHMKAKANHSKHHSEGTEYRKSNVVLFTLNDLLCFYFDCLHLVSHPSVLSLCSVEGV